MNQDQINIKEILELLPHRYPFVLIDRVMEFKAEESIRALKNVTINELYFTGHFPGNPVMPGVLILEAMAQAMAILAIKTFQTRGVQKTGNEIFYFAGIDKVRFKQPVVPGDQLILDVRLTRQKKDIFKAEGVASVNGAVVCSAELMAAYKGGNL